MMMKVRVFVAYASEDRVVVSRIVGQLRRSGLDVAWDQDVNVGEKWEDRLAEDIRKADYFIWMMSKDSIHAPYVVNEHGAAGECDAKIRIVRLDDVDESKAIAQVRKEQWIDYRELAPLVAEMMRDQAGEGATVQYHQAEALAQQAGALAEQAKVLAQEAKARAEHATELMRSFARKLVPTGVIGAFLGGITVWAVQQNANASAKEAVAVGLQSMTSHIVQASTKLRELKRATEAARSVAQFAETRATKATELVDDFESAVSRAEGVEKSLTRIRAASISNGAVVSALMDDAKEFRRLLVVHRKGLSSAAEQIITSREVREQLIDELRGRLCDLPVGCVIVWPWREIPSGWRECDGALMEKARSYTLNQVAGIQLSVPDGFIRLPDFTGAFLIGSATDTDLGRPYWLRRGPPLAADSHARKEQPNALSERSGEEVAQGRVIRWIIRVK